MGNLTARNVPYPDLVDAADLEAAIQPLAQWVNDHPGITDMNTAARDALAGGDRWTGRTIYNTTTARHEVWDGAAWQPVPRVNIPAIGDFTGNTLLTNAAIPSYMSLKKTAAGEAGLPAPAAGATGFLETWKDPAGEGFQTWRYRGLAGGVAGVYYIRRYDAAGGAWTAWSALGGGGVSYAGVSKYAIGGAV